jgi:uncharacterized 2Fe-2S/4Fe-4S cluster protein (DUF4445 family)
MKQYTVVFYPHEKKITVPEGEVLIRAAMDAGVHINASCGGGGVCGKCRVLIESGEVEGGITEKLDRADRENGYRLACLSKVTGDLTVRVPVESSVDPAVLNVQTPGRKTARIREMDLNELKEKGLFLPPIEKRFLKLPPPSAQDNMPDVMRLVGFLKLTHNEHRMEVSLSVIRKLPDVLRESDFEVTVMLARPVIAGSKTHIINVQPGDTTGRHYAVAMDIGTTTVYGQLIDLITGEVIARVGDFNAQISYGEDIISRLVFAEKPGGLDRLHGAVVGTVNGILEKLVKKAVIDCDDISSVTLAGNTTMTQLLLRVNPRYIRRSPYVPASTLYPPISASEVGIQIGEHVSALVYPLISSYVGGDIVAGVMGSGLYRTEKLTLFMDIGTNAEVVIGNREWLACAAASAGPALEGGGIEFGMRAAKGAIEDFSIDPVTYEPMVLTIGNKPPRGICGSGLIAVVATLFELGVINQRGKYNRDLNTPRIRETDGIREYVLVWADQSQAGRDIVLTEPDIDNFIRAKGAIYSASMTLLAEVGLDIRDIEQIIMAGGFGSYIDLEKSMTVGLLPETDPEKVTFIGNGSLLGAKMSALTNRIRKDVGQVMQRMTNFELSETPSYMDNYIAALFLPHTDIDLFPKIKARMEARRAIHN